MHDDSRKRILRTAVLCTLCVAISTASAQAQQADTRRDLLVSPTWLALHINDPELVLLQIGDPAEYRKEHLPGARFVSLDAISRPGMDASDALHLEMLPEKALRSSLESLGISNDSRIVVYYGNDWVTPTTRVVFTLDYAGLAAHTVLLDGGMQAWKRSGGKVTDAPAPSITGKLAPLHLRQNIIIDANWVRANIGKPGIAVVDGRAKAFYDGVQTGRTMTGPQRTGHIAGAKSVPFTEIADDANVFRSQTELAALFAAAGVQPGDTVVGYCHIGQQATGTLFAARLLGHPVKLYDGSYEDWSKHSDYPVENPSASGTQR
jgi:thiosulfate/3-mercaptopyruvate sulfurtransferase